MIIKLAIVGAILVGGAVLISPNLIDLTKGSNISDSITNNLIDMKNNAIDAVDTTIDNTIDEVENTIEKINPSNPLAAQGLMPEVPAGNFGNTISALLQNIRF